LVEQQQIAYGTCHLNRAVIMLKARAKQADWKQETPRH